MNSETDTCRVCNETDLYEFSNYPDLWRVTSDCKSFAPGGRLMICRSCGAVQKPIDKKWQVEADQIYSTYSPYFQSGGVEQAVFNPEKGEPRMRSQVILDNIDDEVGLQDTGKIIDIGCGNGVTLRAFAKYRPQWTLFGHELSELNIDSLTKIQGFEQLYTGELDDLPGDFNLITMMHALEHFTFPLEGLSALKTKLQESGFLFVEVPNAEVTPFDLVIADHVSHFTKHDLMRLAARAGLKAEIVSDSWVTKELSMLATPANNTGTAAITGPSPELCKNRVENQLNWIKAVRDGAVSGKPHSSFGLFGTSVASMWLFGQIEDSVDFFVDEDPSRQGTTLHGRPIYTPDEVPNNSLVYLALIPQVANAVAGRLSRPSVEYKAPPIVGS